MMEVIWYGLVERWVPRFLWDPYIVDFEDQSIYMLDLSNDTGAHGAAVYD